MNKPCLSTWRGRLWSVAASSEPAARRERIGAAFRAEGGYGDIESMGYLDTGA
jgi:hypothetical protein